MDSDTSPTSRSSLLSEDVLTFFLSVPIPLFANPNPASSLFSFSCTATSASDIAWSIAIAETEK